MTGLYIAVGVAALIAALAMLRLYIGVSYIGDLRIFVSLGPIRFDLTPGEDKEADEEEKTTPRREEKKPAGAARKKKEKPPVDFFRAVPVALDYMGKLINKTRRYLYCRKFVLRLNVACGEPDKTACLYGLLSSQAAVLFRAVTSLRCSHNDGDIYCEVTPDFISERPDAMIDAVFGLRIWQCVSLGVTALRGILKISGIRKEEVTADEQRDTAQADN